MVKNPQAQPASEPESSKVSWQVYYVVAIIALALLALVAKFTGIL